MEKTKKNKQKKRKSIIIRTRTTPIHDDDDNNNNNTQEERGLVREPSFDVSKEFWKGLKDHEFFGDKVQHIYIYSTITIASAIKLRQDILKASTPDAPSSSDGIRVHPKPIVVHVHSRGGNVVPMQLLMSMYSLIRVPICSMVDGYAASAATAISILAPYRVAASPFSTTLIHDYMTFQLKNKREAMLADLDQLEGEWAFYKELLMSRMTIDKDALDAVMRRDLIWDVETCMKHGVYDRVLFYDAKHKNVLQVSRDHPLVTGHRGGGQVDDDDNGRRVDVEWTSSTAFNDNWNYVSVSCDVSCPMRLDEIIGRGSLQGLQPIVLRTPSVFVAKYQRRTREQQKRPKRKEEEEEEEEEGDMESCVDERISYAIIPRILACRAPVYGIVDSRVDWWKFLPVFFCTRRYMYDNTSISSFLAYQKAHGYRLSDINANTLVIRNGLVDALTCNVVSARRGGGGGGSVGVRERSVDGSRPILSHRGSKDVIREFLIDMFDKFQTLKPDTCMKLGIIDEVVRLNVNTKL
jgi:ATP-dependent protease ClpP protease subunit